MAKLTRKSYQRKAMTIGATAFAGMALIATGFAAWVISSSAEKNIGGNVNVGTISDKSIELNAKLPDDFKGFSFDSAKDDDTGRVRWDKTNHDTLKVTLTGDYTNASMVNKFTVSLHLGTVNANGSMEKIDTDAETRFKDAEKNGYIVLPECFDKEVEFNTKGVDEEGKKLTLSTDATENKATFEYNIEFKWGSHFSSQNPSIYYDDPTTGGGLTDDAVKTDLQAFYKAMTGKDAATTEEVKLGYSQFTFALIVKADTSGPASK